MLKLIHEWESGLLVPDCMQVLAELYLAPISQETYFTTEAHGKCLNFTNCDFLVGNMQIISFMIS